MNARRSFSTRTRELSRAGEREESGSVGAACRSGQPLDPHPHCFQPAPLPRRPAWRAILLRRHVADALDVALVPDGEILARTAGQVNLNRFEALGLLAIFDAAHRSLREPADVAHVLDGALVFEAQELRRRVERQRDALELTRLALA